MSDNWAAVHVRLDAKGSAGNVHMMHNLLMELDHDWPFCGEISHGHLKDPERFKVCSCCGGRTYYNPRLTPTDIKAAGRQCGVRVKVRVYKDPAKCKAEQKNMAMIAAGEGVGV